VSGAELARAVVYLTVALALLSAQHLFPGFPFNPSRYEAVVILVMMTVVGYLETRVFGRKASGHRKNPPE
jgi:hypothetical protein